MKYLFYIFLISNFYINTNGKKIINTKPSSNTYKHNLPLFWKIGKSSHYINNKPQKIIFDDYPICIYRNNKNEITAVSDICVHRAASLSKGKLLNNGCLQCPYHGWEYKNGVVETVPGCSEMKKNSFGVPNFETLELNDDIYLRPSYDLNSEKGTLYNHSIYIPPEAINKDYVRISGALKISRPNYLITENVLDMLHVSYVHSFGNNLSPIPFKLEYTDQGEMSGKTTFHYTAGLTSMSKILGGADYVKVENEFYLPDTTVTRVYASDELSKTIVTNCYPIGKNESILYYDLYRNFFTNCIFDEIFHWQMRLTLKEDIDILNNVYDEYNKGFMSTKFDITQTKYREKKKKLIKILEKNNNNDQSK